MNIIGLSSTWRRLKKYTSRLKNSSRASAMKEYVVWRTNSNIYWSTAVTNCETKGRWEVSFFALCFRQNKCICEIKMRNGLPWITSFWSLVTDSPVFVFVLRKYRVHWLVSTFLNLIYWRYSIFLTTPSDSHIPQWKHYDMCEVTCHQLIQNDYHSNVWKLFNKYYITTSYIVFIG